MYNELSSYKKNKPKHHPQRLSSLHLNPKCLSRLLVCFRKKRELTETVGVSLLVQKSAKIFLNG